MFADGFIHRREAKGRPGHSFCGDEAKKAKKKDKEVMAYLYEFYRTHAELGTRTLNFIERHDLQAQFREEEN